MDVKSAFNNVDKTLLGKWMEELGVETDLIQWTMSFMSDRQVKLVLDGEVGEPNAVDTGVPQGSPAAPILFVTYLLGIFDVVEAAVPGVHGLSFVDDIGWWADGPDDKAVAENISKKSKTDPSAPIGSFTPIRGEVIFCSRKDLEKKKLFIFT